MAYSHLVVEGLDHTVDEYALKEYFKWYGTLSYIDVKYDDITQKSLGIADVKFTSPSVYVKIFNDGPHTINGNTCKIKLRRDSVIYDDSIMEN
jgi:RNA recognition motif-containing protein